MRHLTTTLLAGLIAAVILACSDDAMHSIGRMMMDAGSELADSGGHAAAQPSDCKQWEVMTLRPDTTSDDCRAKPCSIPAGWEPFADQGAYSGHLWVRRCVSAE